MRQSLLTLTALAVGLTANYAQSDCVETFEGDSTIFDTGYAYGGATIGDSMALFVTPNPDTEGNDSETVLAFVEYDTAVSEFPVWQGFGVGLGEPVRFAEGEPQQFTMLVWGPTAATVPIKLQGDDGADTGDIFATETLADSSQWVTLTYDLSQFDFEGTDYATLSVTPNNGEVPDTTQTWYFDDLTFGSGTGDCGVAEEDGEGDGEEDGEGEGDVVAGECVEDFEGDDTVVGTDATIQFGQDPFADSVLAIVANPDTSGNPSDSVLQFNEYSAAENAWAGLTTELGRDVVIADSVEQVITMMVWGSRAGVVDIKPEIRAGASTGNVSPVEAYDTPGEWKLLTYDFSQFSLADSMFNSLGIIPGNAIVPDEDATWYIDNISFGPAACGMAADTTGADTTDTGIRTPLSDIAALAVYPNPANNVVTVSVAEGATSVALFDAVGRAVLVERLGAPAVPGSVRVLDVAALPAGSYTAVARGERNRVLGRARLLLER